MKPFISIAAAIGLLLGGLQSALWATCASDSAACCCAPVVVEQEPQGCCAEDAAAEPSLPDPCTCTFELPDADIPTRLAPPAPESSKLFAAVVATLPAATWHDSKYQPVLFDDAGPPGPARPRTVLYCSFLL